MTSETSFVLHGYWRSGTSYRTRIALNLKGLAYTQVPVNLLKGEQNSDEFLTLNPQGLVPALEVAGTVLTQSSAIIEWLEERFPEPPLLPQQPEERAIVRVMSMTVACDIHPLNNLRVLRHLKREVGADEAAISSWTAKWIEQGFAALDAMIARHGGIFAFGDSPTAADCHLVPQIYSAERFGVDLHRFPNVAAAGKNAIAVPAIAAAAPEMQPDAPRTDG